MIERLVNEIVEKRMSLEQELADPSIYEDQARYAEVSKAHADLGDSFQLAQEYLEAKAAADDAQAMLEEGGLEPEMREFLQEELDKATDSMHRLDEEIRLAMVEKDPNDAKNALVEIRGAAGGDEATLFAGDLFRMLTRYAESKKLKWEVLSTNESPVGGFKEIIFAVKGKNAYGWLKYESGVHRVQRVPQTESTGRIHTSTATVAVLPEAEEVDISIDPSDLRIDVYRSSGPGGQSVNTTDSAVRITHEPSGLVVSCQDEKSQLQNKERAMRILRSRLQAIAQAEQEAELSASRRSQLGTGERSEKIRTYNFPQGRVTDHRIGLTSHRLEGILEGELDEFREALIAQERADQLAAAEV